MLDRTRRSAEGLKYKTNQKKKNGQDDSRRKKKAVRGREREVIGCLSFTEEPSEDGWVKA